MTTFQLVAVIGAQLVFFGILLGTIITLHMFQVRTSRQDMMEMERRLSDDAKEREVRLTGGIEAVESKLTGEIKAVESRLSGEIKAVESRLVRKFESVEGKLDTLVREVGEVRGAVGVLIADRQREPVETP